MMTKQQITWASEHNWFLHPVYDSEGMAVGVWVSDNALSQSCLFTSFKSLRAWAGY